MSSNESPRERILKTFRREPISEIVWQPRIYNWYYGNRLPNRLPDGYEGPSALNLFNRSLQPFDGPVPEKYRRMSMIEIYEDLRASPRYPTEVLGIPLFLPSIDSDKVRSSFQINEPEVTIHYETPYGTLQEVFKYGRNLEHPVKGPNDMKAMRYVVENTHVAFVPEAFEAAEHAFGDLGVAHGFVPRVPLQRLIIQYLGFEKTIYALNDYPHEMNDLLKAIEAQDDEVYEVVANSPLQIINFAENLDANLDSPRLFQKYFLPYYDKRLAQLQGRGKFCHCHMDGTLKPLLPFVKETAFDGIEAVTPVPQGDVTLEEIKEALGDKILVDGIPAIYFLPEYSTEELEACTRQILEMFSPNLILGISDELPAPADIERLKLVADIVRRFEVAQS